MKCIFCGSLETKVTNSSVSDQGNTCRRVLCKSCSNKFYTIERAVSQVDLDECRNALWVKTRNKENK